MKFGKLRLSIRGSHLWNKGLLDEADGDFAARGAVLADNLVQLLLARLGGGRGNSVSFASPFSPSSTHIELVDVDCGVTFNARPLQLRLDAVNLLPLRRLDKLDDLE